MGNHAAGRFYYYSDSTIGIRMKNIHGCDFYRKKCAAATCAFGRHANFV